MTSEGTQIISDTAVMRPRRTAPAQACKIALYGFGSQPVVHRHLIELAAKNELPLTWCSILPTPHYRSVMSEIMPADDILDVFRALPYPPVGGDLASLARYPGSIAEDLAAQKRPRRKRSGQWLLDRGLDYYNLYKRFLSERGASHVLMSFVETPDAKIIVSAARELGLGVIVPVDMRNMTGTYFSPDCHETPPAYAAADAKSRAQAADFVRSFRASPAPSRAVPAEVTPGDEDVILPDLHPPRWRRIMRFVMNMIERPDIFDYELIRIAVMTNTPLFRKVIRGLRKWRNATQYDIADIAALPERFIYYPLQFSPEASINTPAPYFLDQMRAIDALRFAMPSDYVLAVKEHPACIAMRPVKFMKQLRRLPGVAIVKASIPSVELIKRAAVTATVTGTAAFEAFVLGRPAIALGPGLSAWALGGVSTLADLRSQILTAINEPVPEDFVVDQVARLMSARYGFFFDTPRLPDEPVLRLQNMRRFLASLLDHLERERSLRTEKQMERSPA